LERLLRLSLRCKHRAADPPNFPLHILPYQALLLSRHPPATTTHTLCETQYSSFPNNGQNGNAAAFTSKHDTEASSRKAGGNDPFSNSRMAGQPAASVGTTATTNGSGSMDEFAGAFGDAFDKGKTSSTTFNKEKNGPSRDSNKRTAEDHSGMDYDELSSKWIHRDKLARIESEELQAAGIILPKPRARSRPPRSTISLDKANGAGDDYLKPRSRKNSSAMVEPRTPDINVPSWDLRLPEEIAAESEPYFVVNSDHKGSRIPVAKLSPVPIPAEHIERGTPMSRKRDDSPGADDSIAYPKTRSRSNSMKALEPTISANSQSARRSVTDTSPRKNSAGTRKASAPAKSGAAGTGRPKTRNGPSKDSTSSSGGQTRPTTRSGELSPGGNSKQMEGDPPWMISAYKPDPRLPPDQQLLPTVARRLQQEKWEKEGKFGNTYDTNFRPLTQYSDDFLQLPGQLPGDKENKESEKQQDEWPLKSPEARSPTLSQGRSGSYSTIPKIQEKKPMSPLPSPRSPQAPQLHTQPMTQQAPPPQEQLQQEEPEKKAGCGCCVVM